MATELEVVHGLVNELSSALADMVAAVHEGQAHVGDVGSTLAEMLDLMKARKQVTLPAPEVTVNVPPPQIAIIREESDFEVTHEYDDTGRLVASHVKRVSKGK